MYLEQTIKSFTLCPIVWFLNPKKRNVLICQNLRHLQDLTYFQNSDVDNDCKVWILEEKHHLLFHNFQATNEPDYIKFIINFRIILLTNNRYITLYT